MEINCFKLVKEFVESIHIVLCQEIVVIWCNCDCIVFSIAISSDRTVLSRLVR